MVDKKVLSKIDKNRFDYWCKKLKGAGWISDGGNVWILEGRREIWSILKTDRCLVTCKDEKKRIRYHYTKLSFTGATPSDFFKNGLEAIQNHLSRRRKTHLTQRLVLLEERYKGVTNYIKNTKKPELSCKTSAKLFGYKASSTGRKYRSKYFKVDQSTVVHPYLNMHGCVSFRRETGRISLR